MKRATTIAASLAAVAIILSLRRPATDAAAREFHKLAAGTRLDPLPLDYRKVPPAAQQVPPRKTQPPLDEVAVSIRRAWNALRPGQPLPAAGLRLLGAQYLHETDNGTSMWNYNPAGLKAQPSWSGQWTALRGFEDGASGRVYRIMAWRAFPNLNEGILSWMRLLAGRYSAALDVAQRGGTPEDFAAALKAKGYFTADTGKYAAALRSASSRWTA